MAKWKDLGGKVTARPSRPSAAPGPWDDEPDQIAWVDAATGLRCKAVRDFPGGSWCGYADRSGLSLAQLPDDSAVHWGVTLDNGIWRGFDCAHHGDLEPFRTRDILIPGDVYRDLDFVVGQVEILAQEVRASEVKPMPAPKTFAKSRIFWLSTAVVAVNAGLASLIAADGVPQPVKIGLSAFAAACGVFAAALRVDDYRKAK